MMHLHLSFSICRRHKQLEGNSTLTDDGSKPSVGTGNVIAGTTTTSGLVDFKSTPVTITVFAIFEYLRGLWDNATVMEDGL